MSKFGINKKEFTTYESDLQKMMHILSKENGSETNYDVEDLTFQELEKLTSSMQKQENLLLFSEINRLIQQVKDLNKKL